MPTAPPHAPTGSTTPAPRRRARAAALAGGLLTAVVALAGCGTTEEAAAEAPATTAAAGGPVTLTDARGEVTLDAPAQDVVSLEWGLTENLLTLGVEPVGQADVAGYTTWDTVVPIDADTPDVGFRGEPSLDAIAALDADLVVATTDLPEAVVAQIEQTVPVLVLAGSDASDPLGQMRTTVETLAEATGTQERAATVLADFDTALEDARTQLADAGVAGSTVTMADGWVTDGAVSVRMYTPGSYLGALLAELGLENGWTGEGDPAYGLATTDVEGLAGLGALDFLYVSNGAETDPFADGLAGNAIWEGLPFVAAGDVHRLPDGIWLFGGPASGTAYVDAVVAALAG